MNLAVKLTFNRNQNQFSKGVVGHENPLEKISKISHIARFGMRALMSSPGEITPYRRAPAVVVKTQESSRNFFKYGRRMT